MDENENGTAESQTDIVELACQYLQDKSYPDGCSANKKRQIRQRAQRFSIISGELYYKQDKEHVSMQFCFFFCVVYY